MKKNNMKLVYMNKLDRLDYTHEGFILDHDCKVLWIREDTDRAIRSGNVPYLIKFTDLRVKYPDYRGGLMLGMNAR